MCGVGKAYCCAALLLDFRSLALSSRFCRHQSIISHLSPKCVHSTWGALTKPIPKPSTIMHQSGQRKNDTLYVPLLIRQSSLPVRQSSLPEEYMPVLRLPSHNQATAGGLASPMPHSARNKSSTTIAPGQPAPACRQKDKFVPLPILLDGQEDDQAAAHAAASDPQSSMQITATIQSVPTLAPAAEGTSRRGRITLYCIAEGFDLKRLDELLKRTFPSESVTGYPDCFYVDYMKGTADDPGGDVFFFDYGVVACWGLTGDMEKKVVRSIARQVQERPVAESEILIDEFQFNFSVTEKPHVQNDTVTLSKKFLHDHAMKLAVTYALAQSTKLSKYERRVVELVVQSKSLPETLAETGHVKLSSLEVAKLIGKVFLQKTSVNLLSSVLDTPEFFWQSPDSLHALYTRVLEYLELGNRVELLNSRFRVLQEMLNMLRDQQNNHHGVNLEWIVIWLILVSTLAAVIQALGLFGIVGGH